MQTCKKVNVKNKARKADPRRAELQQPGSVNAAARVDIF